jgi:TonB family protein
MRRLGISVFCFLLSLTPSTHAQSSDQALQDFRAQILNQRLILQSFSADSVTNYKWTANGLTTTPPKVRTIGVFKLNSAKLHNNALELAGSRSTIYKQKNEKPTLLGDAPVVIRIELNGVDPSEVLPRLKEDLFFPTLQAAIAAVPLQDQQMLYPTGEPPPPSPPCPVQSAHYKRPQVTYEEAADFTEEAVRAHFNGSVTVALTVDENGHASDLWVKSPAGLGLDERAIKAVSNYKFHPATCDGIAVKTALTVEVNFAVG